MRTDLSDVTVLQQEIAVEQEHVDRVYARLAELRRDASRAEREGYQLAGVGTFGALVDRSQSLAERLLGNQVADTIIIAGQFDFPGTTMTALAERTVTAAQQLYGTSTANTVRAAFQARGIL